MADADEQVMCRGISVVCMGMYGEADCPQFQSRKQLVVVLLRSW